VKSCLIVDDSKVVRMVARRILEDLSFAVAEAADGAAALDACRAALPDAMLLDRSMPVMDGIECLRRLRTLPGGERTVVVFCSTDNDIAHIKEALAAGANEYVMKPFDNDIIQSKLALVGLIE